MRSGIWRVRRARLSQGGGRATSAPHAQLVAFRAAEARSRGLARFRRTKWTRATVPPARTAPGPPDSRSASPASGSGRRKGGGAVAGGDAEAAVGRRTGRGTAVGQMNFYALVRRQSVSSTRRTRGSRRETAANYL